MLRIADLAWTRDDFCRGWYISGATGSGKTEALKLLMHLLCRSQKSWGGLFIDEKSFFVDEVVPLLGRYGRGRDVVELRIRASPSSAKTPPKFRMNLLGDERVRTSQYVDAILMVAEAVAAGKEDKGFFKTQAGLHIGAAIDLFRGLREWQRALAVPAGEWVAPTLRDVYRILTSQDDFEHLLRQRVPLLVADAEAALVPDFRGVTPPAVLVEALEHFAKRYWGVRAPEQLEGVKGTITNYLRWFADDALHEVFGAEDQTFSIGAVDEGKILCVSLPQHYAIERRYICALLKVLAYAHARSRRPNERAYNLMVIWQDEAQRFILPVDGDVDILRQYGVTTVISTQFRGQIEKALGGKEQANPILGNLRNRIILQAADEDCAEESAKFIGKGLRRKRTYSRDGDGRRSSSFTEEVAHFVEPYQLRKLPKFTAVFCHANGRHRILRFTPLNDRGEVPHWFHELASPSMRWRLLFSRTGPYFSAYSPPKVFVR